jgi:hypothetical protein
MEWQNVAQIKTSVWCIMINNNLNGVVCKLWSYADISDSSMS